MPRNFKYKSDYFTCKTSAVIVDLQRCFYSFTLPILWIADDKLPIGPGFCLRLLNDAKEEVGSAEFQLTGKERILYGKTAKAYSLKRLGPPDMESSLPTISLTTLALPIKELI